MRVLGTDDSVNTCDCCGRTGLKYTVAVETENGSVLHYGCVCAARHTGRTSKDIRKEAKKADDAKKAELERARLQAVAVRDKEWQAFLDARAPRDRFPDRFLQIQACGGYKAAREAFRQQGARQ